MNYENSFQAWRKMVRSSEFDEQVYKAVEQKRVKCFVYLSSGQEAIAASVAQAFYGYKPPIFCQHRSHSAYISFGGDPAKLRDELLNGVLGDPMINDPAIRFYGHSGLVADQVPYAVGYALGNNEPVVCFIGDSTVEEDVFGPSLGLAVTHKLPVLFVLEDNGLSVITQTATRRSWSAVSLATGYGARAAEFIDDPQMIYGAAKMFLGSEPRGPMLLDIHCCRKYRHVGVGKDGDMAWDRLALTREYLNQVDASRTKEIESSAREEMDVLWR